MFGYEYIGSTDTKDVQNVILSVFEYLFILFYLRTSKSQVQCQGHWQLQASQYTQNQLHDKNNRIM